MSLTDTARAKAVERWGKPNPPIRILTQEELRRVEDMEQTMLKVMQRSGHRQSTSDYTIRCYIIEIDWSTDDALLRPTLLGLLKLRPEGIRRHKRHTRKRAALSLHKFKQLAAWRLAKKAGMNYKEAWHLVRQRAKDHPRPDCHFDLLPKYNSAGAWKDAVDAGQKLVRRGC